MPPAPTEAHHRGAAHVDLEAQQGVAHEVRDGLRQGAEAHGDRPRRAAGGDALDRLHVDVLDHLGEQLAERAHACGWRRLGRPATGPSPKAITNTRANTSSGTVRRTSSQKRRTDHAQPAAAAPRWPPRRSTSTNAERHPARCRHRPSAGSRRGSRSQRGRPQNHSATVGPDRAAVLELEQAHDVARESGGWCRTASATRPGRDRRQHHRHGNAGEDDRKRIPTTAHSTPRSASSRGRAGSPAAGR